LGDIIFQRESSPSPIDPRVCNKVYGVIYVLYVLLKGESNGLPVYATKHMEKKKKRKYILHLFFTLALDG